MDLKKRMLQRAKDHPLRIGVYVRVSTKEQATEGVSLDAQQGIADRHIQQWRQEKIPIGAITYYVEAGRSGKDLDRPEMKRLQADVRARRLDLILAYKMDRISRNTVDFRNFQALLDDHEVDPQFFNDRYETGTASDFLANHMNMGAAEYERLVIGERTKTALDIRARSGLWNGGYIFGYRKDEQTEKLVPHPEEAEIVRKHLFDAMEELGSVGRVLQRLHNLGIRYPAQSTARKKGGGERPFEKQQVRRILENPIYLGHVVWGKIRTENAHPAIITEEQAARVRAMLNQNRKRRANTRYSRGRQYPLKGLVLCGCGHHMTPKGATGRIGACFYYQCSRQIHQQSRAECSSPRIPAVALEDGVKGLLRRIGTSPQAREQIVRHALDALGEDATKLKDEATLVRNRLVAVNGEINNLVNVLAKMGTDAADLVKEGLTRLKGEREQLQDKLKELDAAKAPHDVIREQAAKFVTGWTDIGQLLDDADLAEQRVILQHLVHSLVLTAADKGAKHGTYALRLFPEVGPIDPDQGGSDRGPNPDDPKKGPGDRAVLTENGLVRQFGEKAPREGFEPSTRRLTAGCSTVELSRNHHTIYPKHISRLALPDKRRRGGHPNEPGGGTSGFCSCAQAALAQWRSQRVPLPRATKAAMCSAFRSIHRAPRAFSRKPNVFIGSSIRPLPIPRLSANRPAYPTRPRCFASYPTNASTAVRRTGVSSHANSPTTHSRTPGHSPGKSFDRSDS